MAKNKLIKISLSVFILSLIFAFSGCLPTEKPEPTAASTTETTTAATTSPTSSESTESTTKHSDLTTALLTTTFPTTENSEETTVKVWAKQDVNIREKPTTNSKKVGVLHEGNGIIRVGKSVNGWSKVIFDGAEAYISSSYLTEKEPAKAVSSDRIVVDPYSDLWYLVIVDSQREIPADYVPELAEVASSGKYLDFRVAKHYNDMYAAAKKDGIILTPYSGYRSYARQQRNYNNLTETYMSRYNLTRTEAAKKAATVILPPGTSEHNLGLAMDICNTNSSFSSQKEYKWLTEHAHEYGFLLRYTAEKQDITGIIPEPWHWRYVGVEHAGKIKESGLCLEEYLQQIGIAY